MNKKVLVIRFSSIGDIIQCMSVINPLCSQLEADVHWITRSDLTPMLSTNPNLHKIWSYDKKTGVLGLIKMVAELRKEKFDYVYDAHQNARSFMVRTLLGIPRLKKDMALAVRRKKRLARFWFFQFNVRTALPMPFKAVKSFQDPLLEWGLDFTTEYKTDWIFAKEVIARGKELLCTILEEGKCITIVPSAAWELKRWPVEYWQELVRLMPDYRFVIIAGPDDHFTKEIEDVAPTRVFNMAGKTSLLESFYVISKSNIVVSADTGFLHAADLFHVNAIALMGPTAFGHPTGNSVKVLEIDSLRCRPCTKAGNTTCMMPNEYRACLLDIKPQQVVSAIADFA